jgi:MFS family permease
MKTDKKTPSFFYGWIIVISAFWIMFTSYGVQFSFGIFFPILINEFGWTKEKLAGVFSLYTIIYTVFSALTGRWTDVYGPKRVIMIGALLMGFGIGVVSQINSIWHLYLFYGVIAALGMSSVYISVSSTVVKWFVRKRGLALGIAQAGNGLGIFFMTLVSQYFLVTFGWRNSYLILGIIIFVVMGGVSIFLKRDPELHGLRPDGDSEFVTIKTHTDLSEKRNIPRFFQEKIDYLPSEAIKTMSFRLLLPSFMLCSLFLFVPFVHLVMFGMEVGLDKSSAVFAVSLIGIAAIIGRFGLGAISDFIGRKKTLFICIVFQVFSWFWIIWVREAWMINLFSWTFGLSYAGISAMLPAIVGDFFGRKNAGSITGIIFAIDGLCAAAGTFIAGSISDRTGSYELAFIIGVTANILSLIILSFTNPPKKPQQESQ